MDLEASNRAITPDVAGRELVSDDNEIVFEIGNHEEQPDPDDLRARILNRRNHIEDNFLDQAYDLFLVKNNRTYRQWNYESFDAYVISELEMTQTTASEMIRVWKKFNKVAGLQNDEIKSIGFSKARLLTPILNKANAKDWIERAKVSKRKDLELEIKTWNDKHPKLKAIEERSPAALKALEEMKNTDFSSGPASAPPKEETLIKKAFYLYPSQLELVNTVVNEEETKTDSVKQGHNLVCALTELLVARGQFGDKKEKKPHTILALFESAFGGKVVWFKSDDQIKLIEKIMQENPDSFEKEGQNG